MTEGRTTGPNRVTRRRVLQGISVSALAVAAPAIVSRAGETLVVNGYGGEFEEVFRKTTLEPFEKKFGVQITYDHGGMSSEIYAKIRASRGAPGFDVAAEFSEPETLLGAKEGFFERITEKEVPNLKYMWPRSKPLLPFATTNY